MASRVLIFTAVLFLSMPLMAKTYVIQAEGMMCESCAQTVTEGFQKIDEAARVNVDLEKQTVTLNVAETIEISKEEADQILEERGYKFISIKH